MGVLILLVIFLSGSVVFTLFKKNIRTVNPLPFLFLFGSLTTIPLLYFLVSYIATGLFWGIGVWITILSFTFILNWKKVNPPVSFKQVSLFFLISGIFFFAFQRTFVYKDNSFLVSSNTYADMGVHIPVIRSFSQGNNFPFELPFFGGKNLTYHFFYDFYTGVLEFSGIRIDIAYNIIFALALTSLFFVCVDIGKSIFKNKWIGVIAFLLFIMPSDMSFIKVILENANNPLRIWHNNFYHINSFLGDRTLGGFLYINTYLNQRHLLFAIALSLVIFLPFWDLINTHKKQVGVLPFVLLGVFIGLIPLWNVPVFIMVCTLFTMLSILFKVKPVNFSVMMFFVFLSSAPQMLLILASSKNGVLFVPGYIVHDSFSISNILLFWVFNLGLGIITILAGFFLATKTQKKLFIALLPIFLLPNIFQFTKHMFDNHKFFNFWFLYASFFSALLLSVLYRRGKAGKTFSVLLFLVLIISGAFNLLVVKNDVKAKIPDYTTYSFIQKALGIITPGETIITNGEIFDPMSIAGRKTYLGRINDIYSFGGDPQQRIYAIQELFDNSKPGKFSRLENKENMKYLILYKDKDVKNLKKADANAISKFFNIIYENDFGTIYKIY